MSFILHHYFVIVMIKITFQYNVILPHINEIMYTEVKWVSGTYD